MVQCLLENAENGVKGLLRRKRWNVRQWDKEFYYGLL